MQGLLDTNPENIEFVGISLLLMIGVFAIARGSEVLIEKKTDVKFTSEKTKDQQDSNYGDAFSYRGNTYVL